MALKFGVYMCYFFNKKLARFEEKRYLMYMFHNLFGVRQYNFKMEFFNKKTFILDCYNLAKFKESTIELFFNDTMT